MKLDELRAIFHRITYKPGHTIDLQGDFDDGVLLYLSFPAIDVHTGKMSKVGTKRMLPKALWQRMTKDDVLCWVFDEVVGLERHEVCEWLRYDHEPVVEPHPELEEDFVQRALAKRQRRKSFIKSIKSFWPLRSL